jgi:predicted RNA binding protein YcfA (HicA-like mRNA interferase family)
MKLPRDVSASELRSSLRKFGYEVFRQKGSHIRLTTYSNGEHHLTIPNHNPIKLGTL